MSSGLIFKSLIHFEFILVYAVRKYSNSLTCSCIVVQHHLQKKQSFPQLLILASFVIDSFTMYTRVKIWTPYSVPLTESLFLGQQCIFQIITPLKHILMSGTVIPSTLFFFFQNCFDYLWPFVVLYKFQDYLLQLCEKCHDYFERGCLKSIDCSGSEDIFILFILKSMNMKYFYIYLHYLQFSSSISYSFQSDISTILGHMI